MDLKRIRSYLGLCNHPHFDNLKDAMFGDLSWEAGPRGILIEGDPETGKTEMASDEFVRMAVQHPETGMVVLDASGALKAAILNRILTLPEPNQTIMLARLKINILGHPEYVKPSPEFSTKYGASLEDQVNRVAKNLQQLHPEIMEAGIAGGIALGETFKQLCRFLAVMTNEHGESYQVTEARDLLWTPAILKLAIGKFGERAPRAVDYLNHELLGQDGKFDKTYSLRNALGIFDVRSAVATLAHPDPAITIKEVADKGWIYVVSGEKILEQEDMLGYLMVHEYSLAMQYANQRTPNDPANTRLFIVIDELPWLTQFPGVEGKVADTVSRYRARNICLAVIIQSRSQLGRELWNRSWTFGTQVSFRLSNWREAYDLAEQRLKYKPGTEIPLSSTTSRREQAGTTTLTPGEVVTVQERVMIDPHTSQYDQGAYWIQHFANRECLVLREGDKYVRHVALTRDLTYPLASKYRDVHDAKAREDTIRVRDGVEESYARIDALKLGKKPSPSF
jgi:hypothetical protein